MTTLDAKFTPGTFVRARGREWLVLPESTDEILLVRPAGGLDEEVTGIAPAVEPIETATFPMPRPDRPGDHNACRLLRDAARLSTRAAAGPFRSFGRIAVEPRPYQLVPLMMAMRLDPIRLLIADDVGIGKTVEALLIVRELLDRGEITRMAVLCPPHLAEQWQREMAEKFHIDADARAQLDDPATGAQPARGRLGLRTPPLRHRLHRLHQGPKAPGRFPASLPGTRNRR